MSFPLKSWCAALHLGHLISFSTHHPSKDGLGSVFLPAESSLWCIWLHFGDVSAAPGEAGYRQGCQGRRAAPGWWSHWGLTTRILAFTWAPSPRRSKWRTAITCLGAMYLRISHPCSPGQPQSRKKTKKQKKHRDPCRCVWVTGAWDAAWHRRKEAEGWPRGQCLDPEWAWDNLGLLPTLLELALEAMLLLQMFSWF